VKENALKEDTLRMVMKRTNKREFVEDVNGSVRFSDVPIS
jgi:hypothetical protein